MHEVTVRCGCGRTMNLDALRGRGAFRCGCGVRIQIAQTAPSSRRCWYDNCPDAATTQLPLSLCAEHERDAVNHLAHLVVRHDWGAALAASDAVSETYRPLDSYKQRKAPAFDGWIYFMRRERYIKIGTTTDIRRRAQQLNATVLARQPGSYTEEAQLHARFASLRRHGEWFEPGPELLELVNEIRATENLPPIKE